MALNTLNTELTYFNKNRERFLREGMGKVVLIKGKEHFGFYDNDEEAYKAGVELFGTDPFLIKEVIPKDQIHQIPAHYLGLMHAVL